MPALFTEGMVGGGEDFRLYGPLSSRLFLPRIRAAARQIEAPLYYWNLKNEKAFPNGRATTHTTVKSNLLSFQLGKIGFRPFLRTGAPPDRSMHEPHPAAGGVRPHFGKEASPPRNAGSPRAG